MSLINALTGNLLSRAQTQRLRKRFFWHLPDPALYSNQSTFLSTSAFLPRRRWSS